MENRVETPIIDLEYMVDYRSIKYPRLEFRTGTLLLVLPLDYRNETLILEKHKKWILEKQEAIKSALREAENRSLDHARTVEELKTLIGNFIRSYQMEENIKTSRISYRKMRTKWASHISKGNLTFNTLLRYLPDRLIEYVVFHEMAHSLERKHNQSFWNIIERRFKDHRKMEADLLCYWFLVQDTISALPRM